MNKKAWAFFVGVVAAAIISVAVSFVTASPLSATQVGAVLAFTGIGVLSEAMGLTLDYKNSSPIFSSVAYLPLFACVVSFPALGALAAAGVTMLASSLFVRRLSTRVVVVNISEYVVSIYAASLVFGYLAARGTSPTHLSILAYFGMAITFYLVNMAIVAGFLSVRDGIPFDDLLRQMLGPKGASFIADLLASPLGFFAAWMYFRLGIGGIFIAMLPILLVRHSYLYLLQLRRANSDLVRVLIKAIETRDPYTSGHSVRVSTLATAIAEDLHVPRRRIAKIEQAALLHDIGKIEALYAGIISKPHELSPSERAIIRTHATKGADMLREWSATQDEEVVTGVRHHHERYDGSGYPEGLRGTEIPLAARIIMICDALDAMLSDRPYRPALDVESVRRELVRCSGEQFDPEIVRIVLARGTIERARELVQQQPPEAMAHPAIVAAVGVS